MCPACAAFNFKKRTETVDLTGRTFLITGARQKIGYRGALKLLRCGASVIATSRFPSDAATKFAGEDDASEWTHRLFIYGLDFRDISSLEFFCAHITSTFRRLDGIINNAAQTIRRPPAYYAHLMDAERELDEQPVKATEKYKALSTRSPLFPRTWRSRTLAVVE